MTEEGPTDEAHRLLVQAREAREGGRDDLADRLEWRGLDLLEQAQADAQKREEVERAARQWLANEVSMSDE